MLNTMSLFAKAKHCIQGNLGDELNDFLRESGAEPCDDFEQSTNQVKLPILASRESYRFAWEGVKPGETDVVQRNGKLLQFVAHFPYRKKLWMCKFGKHWQELTDSLESQLGPGHRMEVAGKTGIHFRHQDLMVLLSSYKSGRQSIIEIKIARERFCY
ncbi:hypothetical protein QP938_02025 [Porticoccaceae bacterium LTM1]|nr:hypothetical protein QP938_02025 [Porticoccaceae bacterium LTM1]